MFELLLQNEFGTDHMPRCWYAAADKNLPPQKETNKKNKTKQKNHMHKRLAQYGAA